MENARVAKVLQACQDYNIRSRKESGLETYQDIILNLAVARKEDRFGNRHRSLPGKGGRKGKSRRSVKRDGFCENAADWLDSRSLTDR
jgi:hypothetical protein